MWLLLCCRSYVHYKNKYGQTAEGFLAYVKEQVRGTLAAFGRPLAPWWLLVSDIACTDSEHALGQAEQEVCWLPAALQALLFVLSIFTVSSVFTCHK